MNRALARILLSLAFCAPAAAQDVKKEIERYRQMVSEGSPAELFELEGEEIGRAHV